MLKSARVDPTGLKTEALLAYTIAQPLFLKRGFDCVITSINDSAHSARSRHWLGFAFDLRSKHLPEGVRDDIADELATALPGYDALLENKGDRDPETGNEHFHIEYDPRRV
jgi:hypothetical protein